MTLASSPGGVGLSYSGTAMTSPAAVATAIGYQATVRAPDTYESDGQTYQFVSWSDGGARVHDITAPPANFTLTATYQAPLAPPPALPPPGPSTASTPPLSTSIVTPATGRVAPRLTGVSLTHRRFRVARAPTALSARRAPQGTELRYSISENASVVIKVERLEAGVSAGRLCLRRRQGLSGRSCTRASPDGTLTRRARAGANRLPFSGRLGERALAPGPYRATIMGTDDAGNTSRTATLDFTIVTG
jgi:hypothetical protein